MAASVVQTNRTRETDEHFRASVLDWRGLASRTELLTIACRTPELRRTGAICDEKHLGLVTR